MARTPLDLIVPALLLAAALRPSSVRLVRHLDRLRVLDVNFRALDH